MVIYKPLQISIKSKVFAPLLHLAFPHVTLCSYKTSTQTCLQIFCFDSMNQSIEVKQPRTLQLQENEKIKLINKVLPKRVNFSEKRQYQDFDKMSGDILKRQKAEIKKREKKQVYPDIFITNIPQISPYQLQSLTERCAKNTKEYKEIFLFSLAGQAVLLLLLEQIFSNQFKLSQR